MSAKFSFSVFMYLSYTHTTYKWFTMHSWDISGIVVLILTGLQRTQVKFTKGKNRVCTFLTGRQQEIEGKGPLHLSFTLLLLKIYLKIKLISQLPEGCFQKGGTRDLITKTNYMKNLSGNQILFWVYKHLLRYAELFYHFTVTF